jgi:hypothetical protein
LDSPDSELGLAQNETASFPGLTSLDTPHHAPDNFARIVKAASGRRSAGLIARILTRVAV